MIAFWSSEIANKNCNINDEGKPMDRAALEIEAGSGLDDEHEHDHEHSEA